MEVDAAASDVSVEEGISRKAVARNAWGIVAWTALALEMLAGCYNILYDARNCYRRRRVLSVRDHKEDNSNNEKVGLEPAE